MAWLDHSAGLALTALSTVRGACRLDGPKGPPSAPPTIPPIIITPYQYERPEPAIDPRVTPLRPPVAPPPRPAVSCQPGQPCRRLRRA